MLNLSPQSSADILHVARLPVGIPAFIPVTPRHTNDQVMQCPEVTDSPSFVEVQHRNERPIRRNDMAIQPDGFLDDSSTLAPSSESEQELRSLLRQHGAVDEADDVPANQLDRAVDVVSVENHDYATLS